MKKDVLKLAILVLTLITCNVKAQTYSITINSEAEPIPNVLKSGDVINISYGTFTYYQVFFLDKDYNKTYFFFSPTECTFYSQDEDYNKVEKDIVDTTFCPKSYTDEDEIKMGRFIIPTINGESYYFTNTDIYAGYHIITLKILSKVETTSMACKDEELSYGDSTNCLLYATLYNPTSSISFDLSSSKYLLSNFKNDSYWSSMKLTNNENSASITLTNDNYKNTTVSQSAPVDVKLVGFNIKSETNENEKITLEAKNVESQIYYNDQDLSSSTADITLTVNNLLAEEPTTVTTTQSTTTEEVKNPETGVSRYTYLLLPIGLLIASIILFYRKSLFKKL